MEELGLFGIIILIGLIVLYIIVLIKFFQIAKNVKLLAVSHESTKSLMKKADMHMYLGEIDQAIRCNKMALYHHLDNTEGLDPEPFKEIKLKLEKLIREQEAKLKLAQAPPQSN